MLPYFVSFWLNGWNTDLGLETERHHIASFDVGGDESLAAKVVCRSQIYSAWAKLMLISDQARDLVKNCFEGRPLCVLFKTDRLHPGSWVNRLCQQSLRVMIYVEKAKVTEIEGVICWYFFRIKCGNVVPGCLWIVLSVPRTWLIVWFPEVVDRQISGVSWRSCYKKFVNEHKKALRVFDLSDFFLDNRLWSQERCVLGLF